jgi:hypothetical protein
MNTPLEPGSPLPPPQVPERRRDRRSTAFGVTAGLLAGGAVGLLVAMPSFSSAASSDATTPPTTEVVASSDSGTDDSGTADTPDAPDAPPSDADIQAKQQERIRTELQNLVDDGTITAAQADAVAADLATAIPDRGPGGHGGPWGRGGHRGPGFDGEVLAGLLNIDVDTLRSDLRGGKTVAEIATEQGVDPQTVIDALVAEAKSHLDLSVQNGRLTQAEADAKLAEVTQRITDFVNNGFPQRDDAPPADAPADVSASA